MKHSLELVVSEWHTAKLPEVKEEIDIDAVETELDSLVLDRLKNHITVMLLTIQVFNRPINFMEFILKARKILDEYELLFKFNCDMLTNDKD